MSAARRSRGWWAILAVLGCGSPADEPREPPLPDAGRSLAGRAAESEGPIREVVLFDTIPWEGELTSGAVYRIAVHTAAGRVDTLSEITAERPPVVVGDSAVHGLVSDGASVERGFVWRASSRSVESVELPADFAWFLAHALAPDARHLAYVAKLPDGRLQPAVRAWPGGEPVYLGPEVRGYPSDAQNSTVEWTGPDQVELRIRLGVLDPARETWLVVRGRPGASAMAADTIVVAPR